MTNKQSQNGHIQLMKGNVGGGGGGLGSLNAKHVRTKVKRWSETSKNWSQEAYLLNEWRKRLKSTELGKMY